MTKPDYKFLKSNGFLPQLQDGFFSLRLRVAGGQLTAAQLQKASEVAERYGRGYVHLTSRQSIEIPFIAYADIEAVKAALATAELQPAAGGARVRTITGCQGEAVCRSGLIDTSALAAELDRRYYGRSTPHKFKIGITGCRNNCLKAEENDLGIKGGVQPTWSEASCNFCGACGVVCPANAIAVDKEERTLTFAEADCVGCGRCVKSCARKSWQGKTGYLLSFGGLFGNQIVQGRRLLPLVTDEAELHAAIEATLAFFTEHGKSGERFRKTVERVGWTAFEEALQRRDSKIDI